MKLVLREHLREAVRLLDLLSYLRRLLLLCIAKCVGVQDIDAQAQLFRCFPGNGNLIARHHFDFDAHLEGVGDGFLGIRARRIEQGQHADKFPFALLIGPGHTQGTEAAAGKIKNGFVCRCLDFGGISRHLQNDLWSSLGYKKLLPVRPFDGGFRALVHRIEGHKVKHLAALQFLVILHAANHRQVDGVLVFRAGGKRSPENHVPGGDAVYAERIAQCEFVLRECAGLVRAENVYAGQFLNG